MARVTVVAKRRFYYNGRDVPPGPVDMHALDAASYARRGLVSLTVPSAMRRDSVVKADVTPVEPPPVAPEPAVAENDTPAEPSLEDSVREPSPTVEAPERRRRSYRRRDMTAARSADLRTDEDPA